MAPPDDNALDDATTTSEEARDALSPPPSGEPLRPSPILVHLDDALRNVLPDAEYAKLTRFDNAVATTTSRGDFHRCLRCAHWAVELSEDPRRGATVHLAESVRQLVRELHEAARGIRFGSIVAGARPVTDMELNWVDGAVRTAQAVAEQLGWDQVPWEALVAELVDMEHQHEPVSPEAP